MGNFSTKLILGIFLLLISAMVGLYSYDKSSFKNRGGSCCIDKLSDKELEQRVNQIIEGDYSSAVQLASYYSLVGEEDKFLPWMRVAAAGGDVNARKLIAEYLLDNGLLKGEVDPTIIEGFAWLKSAANSGDPTSLDALARYEKKYKLKSKGSGFD